MIAKVGDSWDIITQKRQILIPKFLVSSMWDVEHLRRKAKGSLYIWDLVNKSLSHNVCTAEGINALLNIMFHGSTQITTWYVLIFESDTTPSDTTTYATPIFTESTAYDETTRPAFNEAAAASKLITNSANKATFTINATKTIYGGALVGGGSAATTKGNVAGGGTLYCASKFSSSKAVVDDDVLLITVTITGADA